MPEYKGSSVYEDKSQTVPIQLADAASLERITAYSSVTTIR